MACLWTSAATIPSTDTNTQAVTAPSLTTVSIGTLIPRAATTYTANITTAAASPLPAGTQVGFYETLQSSGEVPYVIESTPLDPFNRMEAVRSLSRVPTPSAETIQTLKDLRSDPEVWVQANYGLGSSLHKIMGTDPIQAADIRTTLVPSRVPTSTIPSRTWRVWPLGWTCQLVRAPGAKWTMAADR